MGIFNRRSRTPTEKQPSDDPLANYVKPKPIGLRAAVVVMYTLSLVFLIPVEIFFFFDRQIDFPNGCIRFDFKHYDPSQ